MVEGDTERAYYVHILLCSDESLYVGMTSDPDLRVAVHRLGLSPRSFTHSRRPVQLLWAETVPAHDEAFRLERQIRGWSRAKKLALIEGGLDAVHSVVREEGRRRENEKRAERNEP